ncbi:MAG: NUDIX domain-containing protein [Candidatus Cloacimonetes bacterium]|nr:NUDIX domain-containing protein [Candidatus Cloacimonadota bacterium]
MEDFTVHVSRLLCRENIQFRFKAGLREFPKKIESLIESTWKHGIIEGFTVWDCLVISLLDYKEVEEILVCEVQNTTYKAFFGTNVCNRDKIADDSILANSIACCCVCETSDGLILFGKRSSTVAEDKNLWHIPGGNIEAKIGNPYDTMLKEIEEELHVFLNDISNLICTGLCRNRLSNKPEFTFYALLKIDSTTLARRLKNAVDKYEHSHFIFCPPEEINEFLSTHSFSEIGKAALRQYSL